MEHAEAPVKRSNVVRGRHIRLLPQPVMDSIAITKRPAAKLEAVHYELVTEDRKMEANQPEDEETS